MQPNRQALRLEHNGSGLATITFTQAERGNPIDDNFCRQFLEAMNSLSTAKPLRAVLIRAEGPNYSFGGDIKAFAANLDTLPDMIYRCTADLNMGIIRALHLPVPVIAQVHGWAMGGAVAMMAGADVVIAGESSRFGAAFTRIGLSCDSGASVTLTLRMGAARARRFMMLDEVLTAAEAKAAGLVDDLVPDAELAARAQALAERLASGPTVAFGESKRLFLRAGAAWMENQLEEEARTIARVVRSDDARQAILAFVDKRKIVFNGR